ncbi:hypothetical protein JWJ88_04695 [Paracoccus methylovorus]|uniref:Uncharacterized protein n=1 Tax=Paracoccus methylovorus TaxID=2812658 RepID=A0ABX7JJT4_9RHOB|nr:MULTISPECIES: hypothetical protein [Paracoccus]QRZ13964.1 hypothetical protein JWJ88_04695 [Paracoccus methylovorus]
MSQPLTPAEARSEARTATGLFVFAGLVVLISVLALAVWGLPALTMVALAATLLVYLMLAAYAAGL